MKAKVIETGEIVEVYREPQHGKVSNIFREAVWFNGRMWNEDELDFLVNSKLKKVDLENRLMIANNGSTLVVWNMKFQKTSSKMGIT